MLRVTAPPTALLAAANRAGEESVRAARVLERIAWPGKPGAGVSVPLLSDAERGRFEAGQQVYRNLCQACHQPDGRGQERLAPSLVGSGLALGAAEVPVRILLHGKEGQVGLMPPVGSVLSDDQIAGVLTYIRREWGGTGAPVDPAVVADVRKRTAGRTRPWTDQELRTADDR